MGGSGADICGTRETSKGGRRTITKQKYFVTNSIITKKTNKDIVVRISTTYIFHSVLIVLKWEIVDIQNSELDKGYSKSHNRFKICNSFDSLVKSGYTIFYLTLHIQYPIKIEMKRKIHILFLVRVLSTSVESILRK